MFRYSTHAAHAITVVAAVLFSGASVASAQKAQPDVTLQAHKRPILHLAFSPDGKRLASAGDDGFVKVWDVAEKKELFSFKETTTNQNQVRFTPDGRQLVTIGADNDIRVFSLETGKKVRSIPIKEVSGGPRCIDLSPDGKTIAMVGRGTLRLYDVASGDQKASYEVHPQYGVNVVAWSADGTKVATAGTDRQALLVDAKDGRVLKTWSTGMRGEAGVLSSDGKTFWVATDDRKVVACDLDANEGEKIVEEGVQIFTLALSKDGKRLILGGPGHAPWMLTTTDRKLVDKNAYDSDDWVKAGAISPDGDWLAGGANGGAIYLWKLPK